MKITFDVTPVVAGQKTGVGFYAFNIIEQILKNYVDNEYLFNFFYIRNKKQKLQSLSPFMKMHNCRIQKCNAIIKYLNSSIAQVIPIPYTLFFKEKAQITHFWSYISLPGVFGKKIVTVYDMTYKVYPETMDYKNRRTLELNMKSSCNRADNIVTISEFSKNEIVDYLNISPDKIKVIPCGVDTNVFNPLQEKKAIENMKNKCNISGDYFLYLGTLEPRKNLVRLIQAYKIIKEKHATIPKLVLAGKRGWLYEEIFQEVKKIKLENEVVFLDYLPDEDRVPLICGAIGFLFPSLYEGFGLPPLEAMACGIPVLTSNIASLPEVVGDTAIKIDPLNVDEIANGIERLLVDNELRTKLSQAGLQRAKIFSWEQSAHKMMELYENII